MTAQVKLRFCNPAKRKVQEIAELEALGASPRKAKNITEKDASDRWWSAQKIQPRQEDTI
jgi:hypothetical protein